MAAMRVCATWSNTICFESAARVLSPQPAGSTLTDDHDMRANRFAQCAKARHRDLSTMCSLSRHGRSIARPRTLLRSRTISRQERRCRLGRTKATLRASGTSMCSRMQPQLLLLLLRRLKRRRIQRPRMSSYRLPRQRLSLRLFHLSQLPISIRLLTRLPIKAGHPMMEYTNHNSRSRRVKRPPPLCHLFLYRQPRALRRRR